MSSETKLFKTDIAGVSSNDKKKYNFHWFEFNFSEAFYFAYSNCNKWLY